MQRDNREDYATDDATKNCQHESSEVRNVMLAAFDAHVSQKRSHKQSVQEHLKDLVQHHVEDHHNCEQYETNAEWLLQNVDVSAVRTPRIRWTGIGDCGNIKSWLAKRIKDDASHDETRPRNFFKVTRWCRARFHLVIKTISWERRWRVWWLTWLAFLKASSNSKLLMPSK